MDALIRQLRTTHPTGGALVVVVEVVACLAMATSMALSSVRGTEFRVGREGLVSARDDLEHPAVGQQHVHQRCCTHALLRAGLLRGVCSLLMRVVLGLVGLARCGLMRAKTPNWGKCCRNCWPRDG